MNWKTFCLFTIVLYTLHDFILKYIAKQIPPAIASFVLNVFAAIGILVVLWQPISAQFSKLLEISCWQVILVMGAGVSLGLATVSFMKAFELNAEFSLAVPIVYTSIIALSVILGYFFLNEKLNIYQLTGLFLSILGIFLLTKTNSTI